MMAEKKIEVVGASYFKIKTSICFCQNQNYECPVALRGFLFMLFNELLFDGYY